MKSPELTTQQGKQSSAQIMTEMGFSKDQGLHSFPGAVTFKTKPETCERFGGTVGSVRWEGRGGGRGQGEGKGGRRRERRNPEEKEALRWEETCRKVSHEYTGERSRQGKRQVVQGGGGYSLALGVGLEVGTRDIGSGYRWVFL